MSSPNSGAEYEFLEKLGIHFEDIEGLIKLVHPLCQDCVSKPCFKTGKCPFVFAESQIEMDQQI